MDKSEATKLAALVRDHCKRQVKDGTCDLCILYSACCSRRSGYCPPYNWQNGCFFAPDEQEPKTIQVFNELKNRLDCKEREVVGALEKLDNYAANTECKDCIFCGDECTFSGSIPAGWDIKEV